jgi:hypothetical protein
MRKPLLFAVLILPLLIGCEALFGTKQDDTTREIFREGRRDPNLVVDDVGYAALTPFWTGFNQPTSVYVGYDELVYVTDADGVHVLDRAGRRYANGFFPVRGATAVTMDRKLNLYVAARYDTIITSLNPAVTWDLAAVYKINGMNQGTPRVVDILVQPFMDGSRSTTSSQRVRLVKGSPTSEERVEITGLAVLADNTLYVTRRGPSNPTGTSQAADNTVLVFEEMEAGGVRNGKMVNTSQIRALSPTVPSLLSGVGLTGITTLVAPPQRDNMSADRGFIVTQGGAGTIPFRVLWVDVVETVNGTEYRPRVQLLARDTSRAERFLYDQSRFTEPSGIAFSGDGRNFILITDAGRDSLYLFQSNGYEGVNPPVGSPTRKTIRVSFGGTGNGVRQFNDPMGVAYFRQVVYVADKGNNRISRFKLNTDLE